ncbi:siderophore-interacting protein [Kribbella sp. NPDC004536]|uniref:siderophore-interacting protein n=1 Tax=Kribbella sp. NPDC004536 TaxID=3364106 RepID=UPI00367FD0AF
MRRTERITPHMIRVVLTSDDFAGNGCTDAYVKLLFCKDGVEYPEPLDLGVVRETYPAEHWPTMRTYTVRDWDEEARELTIDFVYHGDEGVAGPWAASAQPGDVLWFNGPGGGYTPDPEADWHLLVGDESALPAIGAAVESLAPGARAPGRRSWSRSVTRPSSRSSAAPAT